MSAEFLAPGEGGQSFRDMLPALPLSAEMPAAARSKLGRMAAMVGFAAAGLAAFHAAEVVNGSLIWRQKTPVVETLPSPDVLPGHEDHAFVFVPGLGVAYEGSRRMAVTTRPYLSPYGSSIFIAYPQRGLGRTAFQDISNSLEQQLDAGGLRHISIIGHSAGGVNAARILQAPVPDGSAPWSYWKKRGVDIDSVTLFSSPTGSRTIAGTFPQKIASAFSKFPDRSLRGGIVEKFTVNHLNHLLHRKPGTRFRKDLEDFVAVSLDTGSNYSPTTWLQQLKVLGQTENEVWPDLYSPDMPVGLVVPISPEDDDTVLTEGLDKAWARKLGRESIARFSGPGVKHANIADVPEFCARAILANRFGRRTVEASEMVA